MEVNIPAAICLHKIEKHISSGNLDKAAMYLSGLIVSGIEMSSEEKSSIAERLPGYAAKKKGWVIKPNGRFYDGKDVIEEIKKLPNPFKNITGMVILKSLGTKYPSLGVDPSTCRMW